MRQIDKMEVIQFSKVHNVRDLGGMKTSDGLTIKPHKLIRSSKLCDLTDDEASVLTDKYDVKHVIDLRADFEIASTPDPQIPGVTHHILSLIDKETMGLTHVTEDYENMKDFSQLPTMEVLYSAFVGNCIPDQWKKIFDILLSNEDGAVLWHCAEGKDRCGVVSALIEYALGCSMEDIEKDYLKTNDSAVDRSKMAYAHFLSLGHSQTTAEIFSNYFLAKHEFLRSAFSTIENKYGNMDIFLEKACDLSAEKREKLKKLYCK